MKNLIKEYKNYRYAVKNGYCWPMYKAVILKIEYYLKCIFWKVADLFRK